MPGIAQPPHGATGSLEYLTINPLGLSHRYHPAGSSEKVNLLGALQTVTAARRQRLAGLMEIGPAADVRFAIPSAGQAGLPPAVRGCIGEKAEIEGALLVLHHDRNRWSRYLDYLDAVG